MHKTDGHSVQVVDKEEAVNAKLGQELRHTVQVGEKGKEANVVEI